MGRVTSGVYEHLGEMLDALTAPDPPGTV